MRRLALLAILALAACGREPDAPPPAVSFRDRTVPIGATTRGAPEDLAGDWIVSQAFPAGPGGVALAPGSAVRVAAGSGPEVGWTFVPAGGVAVPVATRAVGPGRFAAGESGVSDLVVLWVDDDFRTAVVGTPDGSLGWIMDRPGQASGDRTAAAREVLDWSGYDVARLVAGSGA